MGKAFACCTKEPVTMTAGINVLRARRNDFHQRLRPYCAHGVVNRVRDIGQRCL